MRIDTAPKAITITLMDTEMLNFTNPVISVREWKDKEEMMSYLKIALPEYASEDQIEMVLSVLNEIPPDVPIDEIEKEFIDLYDEKYL